MKIFVCVKQVPDTEAALTIVSGEARINESDIKWIINPYDEYAIEEALKLKESRPEATVIAVTVGPQRGEEVLRKTMAMGVEEAIHVKTDQVLDHRMTARVLAGVLKKEDPGIIFMGKQAIDDDAFLTHLYLGEFMEIPVATGVIACKYGEDKVVVERDIDEGDREKIEMSLPCIIAATKGLNEPRYASLMGIMKAKKKPLKTIELKETGVGEPEKMVEVEKLYAPPEKPEGKILEGEPEEMVGRLVELLKNEAQVL